MIILVVLLIIFILILLTALLFHHLELGHLYSQLELIERGSQIELTAKTRKKDFLHLYAKLNTLFGGFYQNELTYRRADTQLKQTISNIAHDIRTPLTSAAGYLQMLEDCTIGEKELRYEHIIKQRIAELKDMLEELFLYTKLTNPEFTLECRSTAVFPILSDCIVSLYHIFEEKHLEPNIEFEDESICVMATPEGLQRIFRNILMNALTHGNGNIQIRQTQRQIIFTNLVKETETIDVSQLFERFYRGDKARPKGSSGLGLAIVKELVEQMGGSISADAKNGEIVITVTFLSN